MADQFDYQTDAERAEESAWAKLEQAGTAGPAAFPAALAGVKQALQGVADQRVRDGILGSMADYLATSASATELTGLLDAIESDSAAAGAAQQLAVRRYQSGDTAGGDAFADYAARRIRGIRAPGEAAAAWIGLGDSLAAAGRPVNAPLSEAERILAGLPPGAVSAGQGLDIAAAWERGHQPQPAIATVDRALGQARSLAPGDAREGLLLRGLDLYLRAGAIDRAMALLDQLDPETVSLNARTSAQSVLRETGDYAATDRFIARIEQPYERLLALESRLSRASLNGDQVRAGESARAVYDLAPRLADGTEKADAYLLVARYFAQTNRTKDALAVLDLAAAQVRGVPADLKLGYGQRIGELRGLLKAD